ncbi:MAG: DUF4157 domain-containing protein, partial [Actinomycetota bacterium]
MRVHTPQRQSLQQEAPTLARQPRSASPATGPATAERESLQPGVAPGAAGSRLPAERRVEAPSYQIDAGHDFGRIPIHPRPAVVIQAKLAVTTPGDRYEQEADHVSEQVVCMAGLQRRCTCDCGGTCAKCQAAEPTPEPNSVQTQRVRPGAAGAVEAPPVVHEVLAAPGQSLDPSARALMEPRFGHDFSKLRVHTDSRAAEAAGAIGARAFTAGRHLVFGRGEYAPSAPAGQRLLAHELTHVLQQTQPTPRAGAGPEAAQPLGSGEVIQRQPVDAPPVDAPPPAATPPVERKKIRKIILEKRQGVELLELEPEGTETLQVMDHCNPQVGTYTAHVKQNPERPEALDWVTDQNVGCEVKKGYVARTTEARKIGTLQGVTTLEFEVRDDPPGTATGENEGGAGTGGPGHGDQQGAAETQSGAAETEPGAGPRGVRAIWRDITALPKHIQEFLTNPKSGIMPGAEDYETLLRIGQKLERAGVGPEELFEYQGAAGLGGSFAAFERSIDGFLLARANAQTARTQNVLSREKFRASLFGRDAFYKRYQELRSKFVKINYLAAFTGNVVQAIEIDPALLKERDQLHADLIQAGFPRGIFDFEEAIREFEAAFQRETVSIAFDLIRKYAYLLAREYAQFEGGRTDEKSKAAALLQSLGKVRKPAQALYEQASEERDLADAAAAPRGRMRGGERLEGDHAKAAELRRAAAGHEAEAEALVVGAAPDLPVIDWQDFPREQLVGRTTPEAVRYEVAWYLAAHEAAVRRARELLKTKPEHIYELDNLLALSYVMQDIEQG